MKLFKQLSIVFLTICTITFSAQALDIFSVTPAISTPRSVEQYTMSVGSDQVLAFEAADLERRMNIKSSELKGITITALPAVSQGLLFLDGVEVEAYDYLNRDEIDRLCFVPCRQDGSAALSYIPNIQEAVKANLSISILEEANYPPIIEGSGWNTLKNMKISGYISAIDPEQDDVSIQVISAPKKGSVYFNGKIFVYEPFYNVHGNDSFTVCAVDQYGNYSTEASVDIEIENIRSTFLYTDMQGNPSQYAAVKLHENSIITGTQIGNQFYFHPDSMPSRGDFLLMLLAANGTEVTPTVNTGLPNDSELPIWMKPYIKEAINQKIISPDNPFVYNEIPVRAEAVLMTDRAAAIYDVKDYTLTMPDASGIPEWAQPSYKHLAAYRMLDLHDGHAYPDGALTNSYAADLVWQLWKHCNR